MQNTTTNTKYNKYIGTNRKVNAKIISLIKSLNLIVPFIKSVISLLKLLRINPVFNISQFEYYNDILIKEIRNKGIKNTIKLFKEYHRIASCIVLGSDFVPVERRKVIAGTKIPRDLHRLLPLLTGSLWEKRIGMTIMNVYKLLRLPPDPDISAITDKGPEVPLHIIESFQLFLNRVPTFLLTTTKPDRDKRYTYLGYMTSSNGPNGHLLKGHHKDVIALFRDKPLMENVSKLLNLTAPIIYENLEKWKGVLTDIEIFKELDCLHSKVSQLSEGGGKTRNIAIVDYFTQSSLSWIHDEIMSQLRKIRTDATYNQEDGFSIVIEKALKSGICYSLDLSSATDRFPLSLQKLVMNKKFGEEIGGLWAEVLANRTFTLNGQTFKWGRGQPLGALSSWGSFALTHHLFIRWCADDPYFENYVILGDDVAIMDESVAHKYSSMLKECGVAINPNKGFIAKGDNIYGEFAKRIFRNGEELSGIPIDLILSCRKSLYMIPDFLSFIQRRWKVIIPGSELYAPGIFSFLSDKGRKLLTIVLSFRTSLEAKINLGYPWCCLNNDEILLYRVRRRYLERLNERISNFFEGGSRQRNLLMKKMLLDPLQKSQGNHVSDVVVMSLRGQFHPLSLLGIKLLGILSDAEQDIAINLKQLDKLLVEFVPDVLFRSYFYDRNTVRNMTIGKTALEFYFEDMKSIGLSSKK
jgi:hypothetical protein